MATALGGNQQPCAVTGTVNWGLENEGQVLMDALKAFIVPIVQTCLSANCQDPHEASPTPTPSNRDDTILSALMTYVGHLVKAEIDLERDKGAIIPEIEGDTTQVLGSLAVQEVPVPPSESDWQVAYFNTSRLYSSVSNSLWQPENVRKSAKTLMMLWRDNIFNRWPIRVLWFDGTGSIKLIGRIDVYSILEATLFHDLQHGIKGVWEAYFGYYKKPCKYAILSHTWQQHSGGEITYKSWVEGSYDRNAAGYKKLENFCRVSASHGLQFGWMDTLCINKDNSSELDESIRSMYRWYENSDACITYLGESSHIDDIHKDCWFTRGWTLQELVAPHVNFFYNRNWERFTNGENDRRDPKILAEIQQGSQITAHELSSFNHRNKPHISRRMQWAARRDVTREEDTAYSLMGLFDVSMSTAYGEGAQHAFARLIKHIIANPGQNTVAMDIVNCSPQVGAILNSNILPHGPSAFYNIAPPRPLWQHFRPHIPMMITQNGLYVSALLVRGISNASEDLSQQRTWGQASIDDAWSSTMFQLLRDPFESMESPSSGASFAVLLDPFEAEEAEESYPTGALFAVLNHTINNSRVLLPPICLAVRSQISKVHSHQLQIPSDGSIFHTGAQSFPITFSLIDSNRRGAQRHIPIVDLEKNGLYLRTLYM